MTLGEKIQQLRKTNNLSQEQLAEKLVVSRQAISKWELGESIPDTDKIIQLSRIFQVSTDYLLHDDINSDNDIPAVKMDNEFVRKQYGIETLFIVFTGMSIIGLIMSVVAQRTWQTVFSVSIGIIVQIVGVVAFEAMSIRYVKEDAGNKIIWKNFYALNVWLVAPFPVIFLSDFVFSFYPRPRGYGVDLFCTVVAYFVMCGVVTFLLRKRPKSQLI